MIYIPSRMGQFNRRALVRRLQRLGTASRADLAKSLGMSQPTAGKIVDELLELDVLEEVEIPAMENSRGETDVPRGRPGRRLRLNRSTAKLLGIQLGVNETTVAGLPLDAPNADEWHFSFALDDLVNPAKNWETQLRKAAAAVGKTDFLGVLLSVPGIVDEARNCVLFSPNLHWTEKADLGAIVQRIWKAPVLLVQEERALALGHLLANPGWEDFLLVDFGEGFGGAVIVDGRPLACPLPVNGELGHTPVLGNRRPCGCGAMGCIETLVSSRGLLESFSAIMRRKKSSWADLHAHILKNGIEPWLVQTLDAAAVAIAGALNVLGLRRVVVTGTLAELPPAVMTHLSREITKGAMWARFGEIECISAPRQRTAGLIAVGLDRLVVPESAPKKIDLKTSDGGARL